MSDLLLPERVRLQQGRRSRGGILAVAEALPEGWEEGITFRPIGCTEPEVVAPCAVMDTTAARPGAAAIFEPIWIRQSAACSTISQIGTIPISLNRLEGTTEYALGLALATGVGSDNPSFADATIVQVAEADIPVIAAISAVGCLEQAAANLGFGAEVVLHAPVGAAAWLTAGNLMIDGYSPAGHQWIISPGYPGGEVDGDNQVISIWATGTVWAGVSESYVLRDPATGMNPIGWQTNYDAAYAQRLGLAAFDPCLNLAATFQVPVCQGAG